MQCTLGLFLLLTAIPMLPAQIRKSGNTKARVGELEKQIAALKVQVASCCNSGSGGSGNSGSGSSSGSSEPLVAFTALGIAAQLLRVNDIIKFPKVLSNWGMGYNRHTGEFICPVSGVYLFTYSINSYFLMRDSSFMRLRCQASLMIDKSLIVDVLNFNDNSLNYMITTGSNTAITFCQKGSKVFIKSGFDNNAVWSFSLHPRTTFSGLLLKATVKNDFPTFNDPRKGKYEPNVDGDL